MHVCFLIHPLESLDKLDFHCSSLSLVDESLSERLEVAEALSSDVSTLSLVLYVVSAADVCLPFLPLPALLFAPLPFFPDLVEDCRMKQEMMNYESRHASYHLSIHYARQYLPFLLLHNLRVEMRCPHKNPQCCNIDQFDHLRYCSGQVQGMPLPNCILLLYHH